MRDITYIRKRFFDGKYAISDHAIMEARKDGIEPNTVEKLEWVALNGEIIEEYTDRDRILIYAKLVEPDLPVHIIVDYSFLEEPVIVTSYVPDSRYWIKDKIRKKLQRWLHGFVKKKEMSRMQRRNAAKINQPAL